jgi:hypothetical protein
MAGPSRRNSWPKPPLRFGAVSWESQAIEGMWRAGGVGYHDRLTCSFRAGITLLLFPQTLSTSARLNAPTSPKQRRRNW